MKKLDFSKTKLYGRAAELAILKDAYKRVSLAKSNSSEAILVHGCSGTGKSSLIEKLKTYADGSGTFFISGKFDQFLRVSEPYSALSVAFNDLCEQILASSEKGRLSASIKEAVGHQGKILLKVVPRLEAVTGSLSGAEAAGTLQAHNQLKFVFRAFLRSVCTPTSPILLVLDDLQWADTPSLEIISSLLTDSTSKNFLFVGSYRDDEIDETHPLEVQFGKLGKEKPIRWMKLGNLTISEVNGLISDTIELDATTTLPLSEDVYRKTHGNAFFVIQFLMYLQEEHLLYFSRTTFRWSWDMERILAETNLSENVVQVVTGKIQRLPKNVQSALMLAASLGSTFDSDIVELIISHIEQRLKDEEKESDLHNSVADLLQLEDYGGVTGLLDNAVEEDLLVKVATSKYMFAHDRIQQASYALFRDGDKPELLHLWIGELLWQIALSAKENEWLIFVAADQLIRGSKYVVEERERIELAKLNLVAGKRAMALSAFVPAASYIDAGIDLLDKNKAWQQHYELTLNLYQTAAELARCNGDSQYCISLVDTVLTYARCLRDKFRVYFTLLDSLSGQQRFEEAMDKGFSVLAELGEHFPKRPHVVHGMIEVRKTQGMLRGLSDEDLLAHSRMEDEKRVAAMKLLSLLILHGFFLKRKDHLILTTCRMVQLSLHYGMDSVSPLGFAALGILFADVGCDFSAANRFGQLALKLSDHINNNHRTAQLTVMVNACIHHWQVPIQDSLETLLEGYKRGMEGGDTEWAFLSAGAYIFFYFYSGLQLQPLEQDSQSFYQQMVEYNQGGASSSLLVHWQFVHNLMGRSADPLKLTGDAMDEDEFLHMVMVKNNQEGILVVSVVRLQLAYYFGDMETASQALKSASFVKFDTHVFFYIYTFFKGLVALELARTTRRMKHRVRARKVIKTMKKWVRAGAVNSVHKLRLLEAEYKALTSKDNDSTKRYYDSAISMAAKAGFLQDAALANERAGVFFLQRGDEFWASCYLARAHELYCEWGAQAKADHIMSRHSAVFTPSRSKTHAVGHKSRSRFSNRSSLRHKRLPVEHGESSSSI